MFQHGHPVDDAEEFDARRPHLWTPSQCHQRHKSAVRAARDSDLFRIHIAGSFQEFSRENFILEVAAAQVFVVGFLKFDSISRRPTNVRSDADITTRNKGGDARAPVIRGLPRWSAMG